MKKITLVLITTFLFAFTALAQEEENHQKSTTVFGIKGGLNQSYIGGLDNSGGLSYYGGLFAETRLSKRWSIQNELLFSKVEDYNVTISNGTSTFRNDLLLFEVPIHLKYHISDKWSVFAGPKLSFLADGIAENVGLSIEVGVQYNISKRFFIETRYSNDLFDQARQTSTGETLTGPILFSNPVSLGQLRLGLGFKF